MKKLAKKSYEIAIYRDRELHCITRKSKARGGQWGENADLTPEKLTRLGFTDIWGKPLQGYSMSTMQAFVRGHNEFLKAEG